MSAPAEGQCDPAFDQVRDVFDATLAADGELGGALAVTVAGRSVVDLWGGVADRRTERPWERDTRCVTFSVTKAVTATAALLLAERGAVRLEDPVSEWWPEYAAHGKAGTTGLHLLTHQAGLPAFDRPVGTAETADPAAMAALLAEQAPEWEPGTAHGYHATTFGWLVGELVRRHAGMPVGEFVRAEIGADLWVGVSPGMVGGLARIAPGRPGPLGDRPLEHALVARLADAVSDPGSPFSRSTGNPAASFNDPALLTAGWPAAGLVCTARALADFFARLGGGDLLGPELLVAARTEQVCGPDRTLVLDSTFGLGFMLASDNMYLPPAARPGAFGHPGASGALGFADPDRELAFAYIPNVARPMLGDRRAYRLVESVYEVL